MSLRNYETFPALETERMRLRQMTIADSPALARHFGSAAVLQYINLDKPYDTAEEAGILINWFNSMWAGKEGWRWGIVLKSAPDEVIGTCGFHRWEQSVRRAELGYDLRDDYWGQGLGTELLHGMVNFGFTEMHLHRIEADVQAGNIASARVLEKAGFIREGTWRERDFVRGEFVDLWQYGLLEQDER